MCLVPYRFGLGQRQPVFLSDGRQEELRLHHGKGVANAHPRTAAKRHVGKLGQRFFKFRREPLRLKCFRLIKILGQMVHHVGRDEDGAAFGDDVATQFGIFQGKTAV